MWLESYLPIQKTKKFDRKTRSTEYCGKIMFRYRCHTGELHVITPKSNNNYAFLYLCLLS